MGSFSFQAESEQLDLKLFEKQLPFSFEHGSGFAMFQFFNHVFVVRFSPFELLLNGELLDLRLGSFYLQENAVKPVNLRKFPKKTLWGPREIKGLVCKLDVGPDKRLFWKVWSSGSYKAFRGAPFFVFSVEPREETVLVYANDLRKPVAKYSKKWIEKGC